MTKMKKQWEKPIVQSLSVKGITLGGASTQHPEYTGDTGLRLGWGAESDPPTSAS